jgi:hypothetical protein
MKAGSSSMSLPIDMAAGVAKRDVARAPRYSYRNGAKDNPFRISEQASAGLID